MSSEHEMKTEIPRVGHFRPRRVVNQEMIEWSGSPPSKAAIIIQSAIRGGPTFEPAKRWELEQLRLVAPDIIGVHSYAGPHAPEQIISIETERASVRPILANIKQSAEQGWRGVVINDCMADPGLFEVRELIKEMKAPLEIVAPAETSMKHLAQTVGRFAVVGVADTTPIFERLAKTYGLRKNLSGIYVDLNLNPAKLHEVGLEEVARSLYKKVVEAQREGAKGIVFGCTTLGGVLEKLYEQYPNLQGFPLVEPMPVTLRSAAERARTMQTKLR